MSDEGFQFRSAERSSQVMTPAAPPRKYVMNRTLAGCLSLLCLLVAGLTWSYQIEDEFWSGAFVRVGLTLAAVWLVLPSAHHTRGRLPLSPPMVAVLVGLAVLFPRLKAFKQFAIPFALAILLIGYVLRPRKKYRPPS